MLSRERVDEFVRAYGRDSDVRDFLLLDLGGFWAGVEFSSTGEVDPFPALALRPFRLLEYIWLFKTLELADSRCRVLDLGGPASHLTLLAALLGNEVRSVDINPDIVQAGRQCAETLSIKNYRAEVGDIRNLHHLPPGSFQVIVCCSVLEHLIAEDQKAAISEMACALAPGGVIGLTFDYGPAAPGANIYLPPPHDPPASVSQVMERYVHSGLQILGNADLEEPVAGSLFDDDEVRYTIGTLFLGKPPLQHLDVPQPIQRSSSLLSRLSLSEFPRRLYPKIRSFQEDQLSLKLRESELARQHTAAEERLAALRAATEELDAVRAEAELRAQRLEELTAQMCMLERAADERLQALQQVDERKRELEARLLALQEEPVLRHFERNLRKYFSRDKHG